MASRAPSTDHLDSFLYSYSDVGSRFFFLLFNMSLITLFFSLFRVPDVTSFSFPLLIVSRFISLPSSIVFLMLPPVFFLLCSPPYVCLSLSLSPFVYFRIPRLFFLPVLSSFSPLSSSLFTFPSLSFSFGLLSPLLTGTFPSCLSFPLAPFSSRLALPLTRLEMSGKAKRRAAALTYWGSMCG